MRFAGRIQNTVTDLKRNFLFADAHCARSGNDQVKFPFGSVAVEWAMPRPAWHPNQLDFKRRPAGQLRTGLWTLKRERNVAAEAGIFSLRGFAFNPRDCVQIYLLHRSSSRLFPGCERRRGRLAARFDVGKEIKNLLFGQDAHQPFRHWRHLGRLAFLDLIFLDLFLSLLQRISQ